MKESARSESMFSTSHFYLVNYPPYFTSWLECANHSSETPLVLDEDDPLVGSPPSNDPLEETSHEKSVIEEDENHAKSEVVLGDGLEETGLVQKRPKVSVPTVAELLKIIQKSLLEFDDDAEESITIARNVSMEQYIELLDYPGAPRSCLRYQVSTIVTCAR